MIAPILSFGLTVLSLLSRTNAAIGPVAELDIVNRHIAPDGYSRQAVLANGIFPGPLIVGQKGDTFRLNVKDSLNDPTMRTSTSIHWHGLYQEKTTWADGPAFVTQCPIVPGHSFEYNFHVPEQAGTFWYHAHYGTQYCDGLRGPFVIYDDCDPHKDLYDVDDESTVLTIGDWYHPTAEELVARGGPPQPDVTVFNGIGRSVDGPPVPLYVLNVEQGKRYRIRLINIACEPNYNFTIDGHQMTIIETDGENTVPLDVDAIDIFASQRYSFVLHANQPIGNYWIRGNPNVGPTGFQNGINSAILRYKGAPLVEPSTPYINATNPMREVDLHALENPAAPGLPFPGGADILLNFAFSFDPMTSRFATNGVSFQAPTVPVLLQILSGAQSAQSMLDEGGVYTLPPNKVIEISMPGGVNGGPHPFHLHGHTFSVVRSAGSSVYNYENPVRRDVVSIGGRGDNVTIRFVTDNNGPWFLHCHVDWHLDLGLAVVLAENPRDVAYDEPIPQAWYDLCPIYDDYNRTHPSP
ncbi:laccase [Pleurotus eryngii]|uniref:laccase n=1 Tax=Pleurotus eryngii TaxID=5323 RepID=A0A9P5ZWB0_PLEER|nr:laccase [Pleurotus eryngii]